MNQDQFEQFKGSTDYVISDALKNAVNVSIVLKRPLLVRGEPGTGKTLLSHSISVIAGQAADPLEYQVHHQGGRRPVCLRYRAEA